MYLQKFLNKLSNPISHRILFFLILSQSYSQQMYVQDETTNEILPDVVVYNEDKSKSIITNTNGIVDLDIFSGDEKIYFQLLGYSLLERIKNSLVSGDIIYLQEESQALDEVILSVARSESNVNQVAEKVSVIKSEDVFLTSPRLVLNYLNLALVLEFKKVKVEVEPNN